MRIEESNLLSRGRACLISSNVLPCGEKHLVKKMLDQNPMLTCGEQNQSRNNCDLITVLTQINVVEITLQCRVCIAMCSPAETNMS